MAEEKKERVQTAASSGIDRREFFVRIGLGSMGIAAAGTAVFGYQFLSPNVLYEPSPVVNEGKPDRYPLGSVTQDLESGVYIVHGPEGIHAMSAVCTHLGCLTVWNEALGIVACPCHGSKFNRDGTKIEGPAPRPLTWLKAWISDEGDLLVDRSSPLDQKQFVRT